MTCKHKYIKCLGEQETIPPKKPFKIYNCVECHSTVSANKEYKIITGKKDIMPDLINVLKNYINIKKNGK